MTETITALYNEYLAQTADIKSRDQLTPHIILLLSSLSDHDVIELSTQLNSKYRSDEISNEHLWNEKLGKVVPDNEWHLMNGPLMAVVANITDTDGNRRPGTRYAYSPPQEQS